MADAQTSVSATPGYGFQITGRIPRAEALQRYREHLQRQLDFYTGALADLDRVGRAQVSWWRGNKQLDEPKAKETGA